MTEAAAETRVVHDPERGRYELRLGEEPVGVADYRLDGDVASYVHTETFAGYGGRGFAGRLVDHALREEQRAGHQVLPLCWFVADHIRKHPEFLPLVPADRRGRFGLPEDGQAARSGDAGS